MHGAFSDSEWRRWTPDTGVTAYGLNKQSQTSDKSVHIVSIFLFQRLIKMPRNCADQQGIS
jgi:hypothetical protein